MLRAFYARDGQSIFVFIKDDVENVVCVCSEHCFRVAVAQNVFEKLADCAQCWLLFCAVTIAVIGHVTQFFDGNIL